MREDAAGVCARAPEAAPAARPKGRPDFKTHLGETPERHGTCRGATCAVLCAVLPLDLFLGGGLWFSYWIYGEGAPFPIEDRRTAWRSVYALRHAHVVILYSCIRFSKFFTWIYPDFLAAKAALYQCGYQAAAALHSLRFLLLHSIDRSRKNVRP
jgi:hypothetical protein